MNMQWSHPGRCHHTTPPTIDDLLLQARSGLARLDPVLALRAVHDGAILIERNHLEWRCDPASPARIPEATGHHVRWIICCDQGYSSSLAAASLQTLGLSSATDVIGGFQAWRAAGLPVATPGQPSRQRLP